MNIELGDEPQDESEAALFAALPLDFPRPSNLGAVSGAQPKFSMNRYQGRFYSPGSRRRSYLSGGTTAKTLHNSCP